MDAKCPQCEKAAILDDEITVVKCHFCGFEAKYDDYLELMKERVGGMVENFNPDKAGF
ncbi:MAG: zinc-domain-containing protein [Thaumarchaeota archaeon]|nr:MAG: zinc-domain-containing protein [Nitrososphaerota archaeon]TLX82413.1 MAG: zinc-domain-containing protein [Nitrososphaerota archaeon]